MGTLGCSTVTNKYFTQSKRMDAAKVSKEQSTKPES